MLKGFIEIRLKSSEDGGFGLVLMKEPCRVWKYGAGLRRLSRSRMSHHPMALKSRRSFANSRFERIMRTWDTLPLLEDCIEDTGQAQAALQ